MALAICPQATLPKISTMTIMTHIAEIDAETATKREFIVNLNVLSRYLPVYDRGDPVVQSKIGGCVGLKHSSIIPRGIHKKKKDKTNINYKKSPFYNQATLIYEYWGCRYINIMMFRNGKFKMAGTISEHEAQTITQVIIDTVFKGLTIQIYSSVEDLTACEKLYRYGIVCDADTGLFQYYNFNYFEYFAPQTLFKKLKGIERWLKYTGWISGSTISEYITYLQEQLAAIYAEFIMTKEKFNTLLELPTTPENVAHRDIVNAQKQYLNTFHGHLKLAIDWIIELHETDLLVMSEFRHPTQRKFPFIAVERILAFDVLKTELINSDFHGNFVVNNTILQHILNTVYHIFPSYEPNDYPGLKIKYCWHSTQTPEQRALGKCPHALSCVVRGKRSVCTKITIVVFQSGRTIVTAAKTIAQLEEAYAFIKRIFIDNYAAIHRVARGQTAESLNKLYENPSNEIRKMMKKMKLYYIRKTDIIGLPAPL